MLPSLDIIAGGFPCQDISVAGNGKGLDGERSGLVFEYLRLIGECRPRFVFMENVPALTIRGLDRVLLGLNALGYDARWTIISAAEMGAPHLRERIWILAHANGHANGHALRLKPESKRGSGGADQLGSDGAAESLAYAAGEGRQSRGDECRTAAGLPGVGYGRKMLADSSGEGLERWIDAKAAWAVLALGGGGGGGGWPSWLPQPAICRGTDGLADRVNCLRVLGNGVIPICAEEGFSRLGGFITENIYVE
jgi:DNA (cytosine-5)-methyltransferase 1